MWWFWVILSSVMVAVCGVYQKVHGFSINSYVGTCVLVMGVTGWTFPLAYSKAPTFYQAYMLAIGCMATFGWLASAVWFKEAISSVHYFGIVLILTGSVILGK